MKPFDCVIGVDPGVSGGIAFQRKGQPLRVDKMPREVTELSEVLASIKRDCINPVMFIEYVQIRPHDFASGRAFSMEKLVKQMQTIINCAELLGIPRVEVHPKQWQKFVNVTVKGKEEYAVRKRRFTRVAKAHYPNTKIIQQTADSVLILRCGLLKIQDQAYMKENTKGIKSTLL